MPILQVLIPPLPFSLEHPPSRLSHTAFQLSECALLSLTVSQMASPQLSGIGLSRSPLLPEASSLGAPPPLLLHLFQTLLSPLPSEPC